VTEKWEPDFQRLRTAFLLEGEPDRVPMLELIVEGRAMQAVLGRPVETVADYIEFLVKAGYDGARITPTVDFRFFEFEPKEGRRIGVQDHERVWAPEGEGIITSWEDFEKFPFPKPEEVDYSVFEEANKYLPDGMKIVAQQGDIFTRVWEFMGFETFSIALYEQPDLVEALFEKVGSIIYEIFKTMATIDNVGALWYTDDIAYTEGLLMSPEHLRKYLFPWIKKIGEIADEYDLPFLYHTDGVLWDVMEDIIACGVDALHPIEPKAMDIREVKRRYGDRLCLIGNIDLGYTLTRGTPEETEQEVKEKIRDLAPGGGYVVSSSNTIPDYVKPENYIAMIEAVKKYGKYPIQID